MLIRLIALPLLVTAAIGVLIGNYVPLALVFIATVAVLPLLDWLGFHPQRRGTRGWTRT